MNFLFQDSNIPRKNMTDVFMAVSLIFSNPLFRLEITIAVVVPYVGRQRSPCISI